MQSSEMRICDSFWSEMIERTCKDIIPYQYEVLNDSVEGITKSHALENIKIAAGITHGDYEGQLFQDSDVAKWIQAAAYSLKIIKNKELEEKIDSTIEVLERAQKPDGYLNSYYTSVKPDERLTNIAHGHELYCAGHIVEAAVAYAEVTGKEQLLEIAEKCVEYFIEHIGEEKEKKHIYPGHPEIELALYKLYEYTKKEKYLDFMKYLLTERGKQPSFLLEDPGYGEQYKDKWFALKYHQAHARVTEQTEAVGHAVRAMYLYAGMADLAYEQKDKNLLNVLNTLWDDVTLKKMYITGAIGTDEHGEGFTVPYDLPNDRAYAETCASIGLLYWARRMLRIKKDSRYSDIMEKIFYNGMLSGISKDGKEYFYVNPLMVIPEVAECRYDLRHVKTQREPWLGCACCPPNIARTIVSMDKYIYDYDGKTKSFFLHLYISGQIKMEKEMLLEVFGNYVQQGKMKIRYRGKESYMLLGVRIPNWSRKNLFHLNEERIEYKCVAGYAIFERTWHEGDELEIKLDNSLNFVYANPKVSDDVGRIAVQKGPLIYCAEECDNGKNLNALVIDDFGESLPETKKYNSEQCKEQENIVYLKGYKAVSQKDIQLYSYEKSEYIPVTIKLVPYYTWGNRGKGEMLVWIRHANVLK